MTDCLWKNGCSNQSLSLHPCPWSVPSHTYSGLGYMTYFDQWDNCKCKSRLEKYLHIESALLMLLATLTHQVNGLDQCLPGNEWHTTHLFPSPVLTTSQPPDIQARSVDINGWVNPEDKHETETVPADCSPNHQPTESWANIWLF